MVPVGVKGRALVVRTALGELRRSSAGGEVGEMGAGTSASGGVRLCCSSPPAWSPGVRQEGWCR